MAKQTEIAIPESVVADLEEWGKLTAKLFGRIRRAALKPKAGSKSQAWYWSEKWQEWERQADEDIAAGRVKGFDSVEELVADLNA